MTNQNKNKLKNLLTESIVNETEDYQDMLADDVEGITLDYTDDINDWYNGDVAVEEEDINLDPIEEDNSEGFQSIARF